MGDTGLPGLEGMPGLAGRAGPAGPQGKLGLLGQSGPKVIIGVVFFMRSNTSFLNTMEQVCMNTISVHSFSGAE